MRGASVRILGLGAVICIALLACARVPGPVGSPRYLVTLAVAAVAYLFAVRELAQTQKYPRSIFLVCLLLGFAWRIPFLVVPPGPQDDVLRYVWDGRLQHHGYNPYTAIPADPALAGLHTAETRQMNNPDVPSPYPAGAQLFFRLVTSIHESAFAFKIAFAICDVAIVLLLIGELRRAGREEHLALVYAWHPLLAQCVAYNSHIDILGALLLLISAIALRRRAGAVAAVTIALAVTVKFLPLVLAPLYWRRVRLRDALLAAVIVVLLYAPFLGSGVAPIGSLSAVIQRFRFNDPVFAALERALHPRTAAAVAFVVGLFMATWLRWKREAGSWDSFAWPMAASLVCAPVVYPWYLLWLLPFLNFATALPLMVWSVSILSVLYVWYLYTLGAPWQVPGWVLLLEFAPVAAAGVVVLVRKGTIRK